MNDITELIRQKYDQRANNYDRMMAPMEKIMMAKWRKQLLSNVNGLILEAGVGTGANLPFYPEGSKVVAVDFSPGMLKLAEDKLPLSRAKVELQLADIQELPFADNSFDTVVAACVFCSVPDPIQGFRELRRVIKPEGKLYFLEHVRSEGYILGPLMDYLNPWVVKMSGTNINRKTEANMRLAGIKILHCERLFGDIVKLIAGVPDKC